MGSETLDPVALGLRIIEEVEKLAKFTPNMTATFKGRIDTAPFEIAIRLTHPTPGDSPCKP